MCHVLREKTAQPLSVQKIHDSLLNLKRRVYKDIDHKYRAINEVQQQVLLQRPQLEQYKVWT